MKQLTKIFGSSLGYTIDIFGDGRYVLVHPRCRSSCRRHKGITKNTRCTCKNKTLNTRYYAFFKKVKCACNVYVYKLLRTMRDDMGFVETSSMENDFNTIKTTLYKRTVNDRALMSSKGRFQNINANDLI